MATRNNKLVPARAIHPGEILREELQERGIKQKDFAQMIGVQSTHLNEFIKGKRNLNEDLAMKLEKQLGIPFKTWMNLHNGYVYDCKVLEEREEGEQQAFAFEKACSGIFNLNLLYKRLGISMFPCLDRVARIKEMFPFDLLSSSELKLQVAGLYKHSEKVQIDEKNMQTWLLLNWLATSKTKVQTEYKKGDGLTVANAIAKMANNRTLSTQTLKECLNQHGILYIEVEKLDKVPVDAYSTIVDGHPAVTVTYRYNDMDKLAFDVLHELCHIEKHLSEEQKAFISIEGTLYSTDPREKEANEFARQHLIPDDVWHSILQVGSSNLTPHKIVRTIAEEASNRGISPSIAISRYKHDTNWYNTSAYRSPKIH
ncbi:MAG: HigA family addiction module antidote protein [Paludibacteraceae bacterium]|nr:HigA family addiction module antidote protein [Paludibacteraceae bacterium]